jgi:hypothetical protein
MFILACSELEDVREHDRRVTEEAEIAQRDVSEFSSLTIHTPFYFCLASISS